MFYSRIARPAARAQAGYSLSHVPLLLARSCPCACCINRSPRHQGVFEKMCHVAFRTLHASRTTLPASRLFCATFSFTPASLATQPAGLLRASPGSFHFRPQVSALNLSFPGPLARLPAPAAPCGPGYCTTGASKPGRAERPTRTCGQVAHSGYGAGG